MHSGLQKPNSKMLKVYLTSVPFKQNICPIDYKYIWIRFIMRNNHLFFHHEEKVINSYFYFFMVLS